MCEFYAKDYWVIAHQPLSSFLKHCGNGCLKKCIDTFSYIHSTVSYYWDTKKQKSYTVSSSYTGLSVIPEFAQIPDPENFSPARRNIELTVCFVRSLVFGYTGFLVYTGLKITESQPQSGIREQLIVYSLLLLYRTEVGGDWAYKKNW